MAPLERSNTPYRTVWISDVHLGSKGCRAEFLCDFLHNVECQQLYLVGDIIDLWAMRRSVHWPQSHNEVVQAILKKARQGVRVVYLPGNHDELLREYEATLLGNVELCKEAEHTTALGKRLLIIHGDQFDKVVTCSRVKEALGCFGYDLLIWLNRVVNKFRRLSGHPYWSLAGYLKHRVKDAMSHIRNFEQAAAYEAKRRGYDGVVCGHVHHADVRMIDEVLYCNDGDWVENCTALVEQADGTLKLLHWADRRHALKTVPFSTPINSAA